MKIYPNPSDGLFNIDFKGVINENIKINIFNMIGKKIYEFKSDYYRDSHLEINLSNYPPGPYLLELNMGQASQNYSHGEYISQFVYV